MKEEKFPTQRYHKSGQGEESLEPRRVLRKRTGEHSAQRSCQTTLMSWDAAHGNLFLLLRWRPLAGLLTITLHGVRSSLLVQIPGAESPVSGVQFQSLTVALRLHRPNRSEDKTPRLVVKHSHQTRTLKEIHTLV